MQDTELLEYTTSINDLDGAEASTPRIALGMRETTGLS